MTIKGFDDTIDWYNKNSKEYADALNTAVPTPAIEKFLKYLPEKPRVLEAGCGPGRESEIFLKHGAEIAGVDMSEGLLNIARVKNPQAKYSKEDFRKLSFANSSFDGVWAHASLVHLEQISDVESSLKEFHRVLKPGGYLYVYVKAQTGTNKTAVVTDSLSKHDRFFRYYTPEEMTELLTKAGFEIKAKEMQEDQHGRAEVKWIEIIAKKS